MHPQVKQFRDLLSRFKRKRPKSTENIFFTYTDIARAFHVHINTVRYWKLPRLPITRQFVEAWRNRLTYRYKCGTLIKLLELRLCEGATNKYIKQNLKSNDDKLQAMWREGLRRYEELQPMSDRLPANLGEALETWQRERVEKKATRDRLKMKRINELRKAKRTRTEVDGNTHLQARAQVHRTSTVLSRPAPKR